VTRSQSSILAEESRARRRLAAEREARALAARCAALEEPARQAAVTTYQIERERALRQGKPVLRTIDEYRRGLFHIPHDVHIG
jgi:hypothetical protein